MTTQTILKTVTSVSCFSCRFLIFEFLLPSIQIILFCLCIGREPYDLNVAVVNNETCQQPFSASCVYLSYINNHTIVQVGGEGDLTPRWGQWVMVRSSTGGLRFKSCYSCVKIIIQCQIYSCCL